MLGSNVPKNQSSVIFFSLALKRIQKGIIIVNKHPVKLMERKFSLRRAESG